jgi:preprotein translocase subunit YajC
MDFLTLAQTPTNQPGGGLLVVALPMVFMLAVFYLLLIRPQRKQEKVRQEMLKALQKNDKVVTIGGIHGVVANVRKEDDVVTLKVDESGNVRVRVSRSAISRILDKDEGEGGE